MPNNYSINTNFDFILSNHTILRALIRLMQIAFKEFENEEKLREWAENFLKHHQKAHKLDFSPLSKLQQIAVLNCLFSKKGGGYRLNRKSCIAIQLCQDGTTLYLERANSKLKARSKNEFTIVDVPTYQEIAENKGDPLIITSNQAVEENREINFLHTVWERSKHNCSIIPGILADHFARSDENIDFFTDVMYEPYKKKFKIKNKKKKVIANIARFGIMSGTSIESNKRIRNSNEKNSSSRRLKALRISNILLYLINQGQTGAHLSFRDTLDLQPIIKALKIWLRSVDINAHIDDPFGHKGDELDAVLADVIDLNSFKATRLKRNFKVLLSAEYAWLGGVKKRRYSLVYFENIDETESDKLFYLDSSHSENDFAEKREKRKNKALIQAIKQGRQWAIKNILQGDFIIVADALKVAKGKFYFKDLVTHRFKYMHRSLFKKLCFENFDIDNLALSQVVIRFPSFVKNFGFKYDYNADYVNLLLSSLADRYKEPAFFPLQCDDSALINFSFSELNKEQLIIPFAIFNEEEGTSWALFFIDCKSENILYFNFCLDEMNVVSFSFLTHPELETYRVTQKVVFEEGLSDEKNSIHLGFFMFEVMLVLLDTFYSAEAGPCDLKSLDEIYKDPYNIYIGRAVHEDSVLGLLSHQFKDGAEDKESFSYCG